MGGQNPYIKDVEVDKPTRSFRVTFVDEQGAEHSVDVVPEKIPYGDHGLPGSLLDIAMAHGVEIDHACGGVCACSTCHVIVKAGLDSCSEATDDEEDQLDDAYGLTADSRLACQCVPTGKQDLKVVVPKWNRNLAREPH